MSTLSKIVSRLSKIVSRQTQKTRTSKHPHRLDPATRARPQLLKRLTPNRPYPFARLNRLVTKPLCSQDGSNGFLPDESYVGSALKMAACPKYISPGRARPGSH